MQIERNLGADVIMQFDHVIPGQSAEAPRAMRASGVFDGWCVVSSEFERLPYPEHGSVSQSSKGASTRRCAASLRARSDRIGDWLGYGSAGCRRRVEAGHVRDARGRERRAARATGRGTSWVSDSPRTSSRA
jgi:hypothetical protein